MAEYVYSHEFKVMNHIMQKQIEHFDLTFVHQNTTRYVANRIRYNAWRSLKHTLTKDGIVDGGVVYNLANGRCECGLGKESGMPCSHELYWTLKEKQLSFKDLLMPRWYAKFD